MSSTSSLEQVDPLPNLRDTNLDLILEIMNEGNESPTGNADTSGNATPAMDPQRVTALDTVAYRSDSSLNHSGEDQVLGMGDQYLGDLNTSDSGSQSVQTHEEIPTPADRNEPPDKNIGHGKAEKTINPSGQKEIVENPRVGPNKGPVDRGEKGKGGQPPRKVLHYSLFDDSQGNFETRHEFHDPPINHRDTTNPVPAHRESTQEVRIYPSLQNTVAGNNKQEHVNVSVIQNLEKVLKTLPSITKTIGDDPRGLTPGAALLQPIPEESPMVPQPRGQAQRTEGPRITSVTHHQEDHGLGIPPGGLPVKPVDRFEEIHSDEHSEYVPRGLDTTEFTAADITSMINHLKSQQTGRQSSSSPSYIGLNTVATGLDHLARGGPVYRDRSISPINPHPDYTGYESVDEIFTRPYPDEREQRIEERSSELHYADMDWSTPSQNMVRSHFGRSPQRQRSHLGSSPQRERRSNTISGHSLPPMYGMDTDIVGRTVNPTNRPGHRSTIHNSPSSREQTVTWNTFRPGQLSTNEAVTMIERRDFHPPPREDESDSPDQNEGRRNQGELLYEPQNKISRLVRRVQEHTANIREINEPGNHRLVQDRIQSAKTDRKKLQSSLDGILDRGSRAGPIENLAHQALKELDRATTKVLTGLFRYEQTLKRREDRKKNMPSLKPATWSGGHSGFRKFSQDATWIRETYHVPSEQYAALRGLLTPGTELYRLAEKFQYHRDPVQAMMKLYSSTLGSGAAEVNRLERTLVAELDIDHHDAPKKLAKNAMRILTTIAEINQLGSDTSPCYISQQAAADCLYGLDTKTIRTWIGVFQEPPGQRQVGYWQSVLRQEADTTLQLQTRIASSRPIPMKPLASAHPPSKHVTGSRMTKTESDQVQVRGTSQLPGSTRRPRTEKPAVNRICSFCGKNHIPFRCNEVTKEVPIYFLDRKKVCEKCVQPYTDKVSHNCGHQRTLKDGTTKFTPGEELICQNCRRNSWKFCTCPKDRAKPPQRKRPDQGARQTSGLILRAT